MHRFARMQGRLRLIGFWKNPYPCISQRFYAIVGSSQEKVPENNPTDKPIGMGKHNDYVHPDRKKTKPL